MARRHPTARGGEAFLSRCVAQQRGAYQGRKRTLPRKQAAQLRRRAAVGEQIDRPDPCAGLPGHPPCDSKQGNFPNRPKGESTGQGRGSRPKSGSPKLGLPTPVYRCTAARPPTKHANCTVLHGWPRKNSELVALRDGRPATAHVGKVLLHFHRRVGTSGSPLRRG